jgi:hypothetical protein
VKEFEKQPTENWPIAFEFKDKLPMGLSLISGTVSAVRLDTSTTDNTVLASTVLAINGTQALMRVQAGASGVDYKLSALVLLSDALTMLEEDALMHVVGR